MSTKSLERASLAAVAAGAVARAARAAGGGQIGDLLSNLKSDDEKVRTEAWLGAGPCGPGALKPLAALVVEGELEVSRAANRAMWKIARHAGRPGANNEKKAAVAELISLLGDDQPAGVRREVLWMLSEIGGDEAVDPVAKLLGNQELREDARLVLDRIPGGKSLAALQAALASVPDDFKINVAESLRHRGVEVPGLPCQKLVPTKQTTVKPVTTVTPEPSDKPAKGKGGKGGRSAGGKSRK